MQSLHEIGGCRCHWIHLELSAAHPDCNFNELLACRICHAAIAGWKQVTTSPSNMYCIFQRLLPELGTTIGIATGSSVVWVPRLRTAGMFGSNEAQIDCRPLFFRMFRERVRSLSVLLTTQEREQLSCRLLANEITCESFSFWQLRFHVS